ncbi:MAG: 30S ribosomal protein S13 [Candidatus Omnitrophica bacterium]|nr:30S ribosomal protein S13 [Candidatus Omnitrophota bacterium]
MPRICGVDIPKEKRIEMSLTYICGIGKTLSGEVLKATGINPDTRAKDLSGEDIAKLTAYIVKNYKVEGDLKRDIAQNIKRLIDIGAYRGTRHRKGLPARGQRTKTNARTRKGPRKTVGIIRKQAAPAAARKE